MTAVDGLAHSDDLSMDVLLNMLSGDEGGVLGALSTAEDSFAGDGEALGRRQMAAILMRRYVEQDPASITPEVKKGVIAGFLISPNVMAEHISCLIRSILQKDCSWPQLLTLITDHSYKQPLKFIKLIEICAAELMQFLKSESGLRVVQMILDYTCATIAVDRSPLPIDQAPRSADVRTEALKALRAVLHCIVSVDGTSCRRWPDESCTLSDEDASLDEEEAVESDDEVSWESDNISGVTLDFLRKAQSCVLRGLDGVIMRDLELLTIGSELLKCQNAIWRTYAAIGVWSDMHMEEVLTITLTQLSDYYTIYCRMVIDSEEDDLCLQDNAPVLYILDIIHTLTEFQCAAIYMKLHQFFYILLLYSQLTYKQCLELDLEELGLIEDPYAQNIPLNEQSEIRSATLALMQQYLRADSSNCRGRLSARQAVIESLAHLARDHADRWKVEECVLFFAGALCQDFFTVHVLHSAGAVLGSISDRGGLTRCRQNKSIPAKLADRSLLLARSMSILALHASQVVKLFERDLVELVSRVTTILMTAKDLRLKGSAVNCLLQLCDIGSDRIIGLIDSDGILMHCERLLLEGETDLYRRLCVKALEITRGGVALKERLVLALLQSGVNHQIQLTEYIEKMHPSEETRIGREVIWASLMNFYEREWPLRNSSDLISSQLNQSGPPRLTLAHLSVTLACLPSLLRRKIANCEKYEEKIFNVISSPDFIEGECVGCQDVSQLTLRSMLAISERWSDLDAAVRLIAIITQLWLSARLREAASDEADDATLGLIVDAYGAVVDGAISRGLKGDIAGLFACLLDLVSEESLNTSHRRTVLQSLVDSLAKLGKADCEELLRKLHSLNFGNITVKQRLDSAISELIDDTAVK